MSAGRVNGECMKRKTVNHKKNLKCSYNKRKIQENIINIKS